MRLVQVYADLLPSSGKLESGLTPDELLQEVKDAWASRTKTQLFRSPLVSYLYERGWRQGFKNAGFPGIDVEFEEVKSFFAEAEGGVVVDMSCGSGLMTRRLATCDYARRPNPNPSPNPSPGLNPNPNPNPNLRLRQAA